MREIREYDETPEIRQLTDEDRRAIFEELDASFLVEDDADKATELDGREPLEPKEWEVKIWEPHIKGTNVHSEEQAIAVIEDIIPGILKHREFETLRTQIAIHTHVINEFGHREKARYEEINAFATKYDYPSSTIEAWVLQGVRPSTYRIINENAMTREEGASLVSDIRAKLGGLTTKEALDASLDVPYHEVRTKTLPTFKRDYENACKFYELLDVLVDGGVLSDITERIGMDRLTARRYTLERSFPRLVRKILRSISNPVQEIKTLPVDVKRYDVLLQRHPHIKDVEDFDQNDRHVRAYLKLKQMQRTRTLPRMSQEAIGRMLGISGSRVNMYLSDKSQPYLLTMLMGHEEARLAHEKRMKPAALDHRIEPELVHRELAQCQDILNVGDVARAFRAIYRLTSITSRVRWIDLRIRTPTGQEWFKEARTFCKKHRTSLEDELNEQLGLDNDPENHLRLGVVGSRVFLRLEDIRERSWMRLYNDEMFHFHDPQVLDQLQTSAKERLSLKGEINLSRLVHQVTDYDRAVTDRGMNTDLHPTASYIKGSTLSLLLDVCGMPIQDIEADIAAIGRIDRRLIRNPRFSDDPLEVDKAFARVFGAGLSDGHINQFREFCYAEADEDRIRIFQDHVRFFGEVDYTQEVDENGTSEIRYAAVFGRMLEKLGFTLGDKTIQNCGIPDFILNGSVEVQVEYLKQLWAEDGDFVYKDGFHKAFRWTRGVTLIDPEKDVRYEVDNGFSEEMLSLIRDHGEYTEECSFADRELYPRYVLSRVELEKCGKSKNPDISIIAKHFRSLIKSCRSILLENEQFLLEVNGITTKPSYNEITYYLGTGRVSVLWRARTKTLDDAMKVALIAPPDDKRKKMQVLEWVESEPERHQRIRKEMMVKGYQISLGEDNNPNDH